jgi:hypothetical protein
MPASPADALSAACAAMPMPAAAFARLWPVVFAEPVDPPFGRRSDELAQRIRAGRRRLDQVIARARGI